MIYLVAAIGIMVSVILAIVRALLGPTVYDRVLAVNNAGTNTVLLHLGGGLPLGPAATSWTWRWSTR